MKKLLVYIVFIFAIVSVKNACNDSGTYKTGYMEYFGLTTLTTTDIVADQILFDGSGDQYIISSIESSDHVVVTSLDSSDAENWTTTYASAKLITQSASFGTGGTNLWIVFIDSGTGNLVTVELAKSNGSQTNKIEYVVVGTVDPDHASIAWFYAPDGFFFKAFADAGATPLTCKLEVSSTADLDCLKIDNTDKLFEHQMAIGIDADNVLMIGEYNLVSSGFVGLEVILYDFANSNMTYGLYHPKITYTDNIWMTKDGTTGNVCKLILKRGVRELAVSYMDPATGGLTYVLLIKFDSTIMTTTDAKIVDAYSDNGVVHMLISDTDSYYVIFDSNDHSVIGYKHSFADHANTLESFSLDSGDDYTYFIGKDTTTDTFVRLKTNFDDDIDYAFMFWEEITSLLSVAPDSTYKYRTISYEDDLVTETVAGETGNTYSGVTDTITFDPNTDSEIYEVYIWPNDDMTDEFYQDSTGNVFEHDYECYNQIPDSYDITYELVQLVEVEDEDGEITVEETDLPDWVTVDSDSGDVNVELPPDLGTWDFKFTATYGGSYVSTQELALDIVVDPNAPVEEPEPEDKEYCFGAEKKSSCIWYIVLIGLAGIIVWVVILVLITIVCVKQYKKRKAQKEKAKEEELVESESEQLRNFAMQQIQQEMVIPNP